MKTLTAQNDLSDLCAQALNLLEELELTKKGENTVDLEQTKMRSELFEELKRKLALLAGPESEANS